MSLEKLFHLKENHTDVKTEIMAGVSGNYHLHDHGLYPGC